MSGFAIGVFVGMLVGAGIYRLIENIILARYIARAYGMPSRKRRRR